MRQTFGALIHCWYSKSLFSLPKGVSAPEMTFRRRHSIYVLSVVFKVHEMPTENGGEDHYLVSARLQRCQYRVFFYPSRICILNPCPCSPSCSPAVRSWSTAADSHRTCNLTAVLPRYTARPCFYFFRWTLSVRPGHCSRVPCNLASGKHQWQLTFV